MSNQENNVVSKIEINAGVPVKFNKFQVTLLETGVLIIQTDTDIQGVHSSDNGKIELIPKHS